ncbi:MAG: Asp-tRNA(Asn)/Glu-tRNA(Gln) amidotransferase subunit GatC [Deltaproteobacteria bacterium]|nr:Asp-tRNA(Asn)/Glu-tRNA(Gln) amidotransferase subunit GatC [Deltaproteobacteria bacterium]
MKISRKEVEHVADLARLELSSVEIGRFTGQMDAILSYIDKLNELDTADVEPTSHVIRVGNVIREDRVCDSIPQAETLSNAPKSGKGFFKVPKII